MKLSPNWTYAGELPMDSENEQSKYPEETLKEPHLWELLFVSLEKKNIKRAR